MENMAGLTCDLLVDETDTEGSILVGFSKELGIGWSDSTFPGHDCWWIPSRYVEFVDRITYNKFK